MHKNSLGKKSIERTVECFFLQLSQNWKHFVVNNDWTHSWVKLIKLIPKFQNKLTSLYANIVVLFFSWSCQLLQNIYSLIMKNHILSALVANSIRGFNLSSTQKIAQEQKFLFFSKIEGVVDTRCEFFSKGILSARIFYRNNSFQISILRSLSLISYYF